MKQIKIESGNILIIEIPEKIETCEYMEYYKKYIDSAMSLKDFKNFYNNDPYASIILGKLSELSEKECRDFVDYSIKGLTNEDTWRDYNFDEWEECFSAKESFLSLLQSEKIDTTNEDKLLIIKLL